MRILWIILLLTVAGAGVWAWSAARGHAASAPAVLTARVTPEDKNWGPIRVMTANIRISSAGDGDNIWPNRRELLVKTFLKYQPEILACQEVAPAQGAYLSKELAQWYDYYWRAGVGVEAGVMNETLGSLNRIYFRSDRFEAIDGDTGFILPNEPQADPAENALFTLVVLKEKGSGEPLIVVDVHLRHQDPFAIRCATALRAKLGVWMKKYPEADGRMSPVIVTGDMNHDKMSAVYPALLGGPDRGAGGAEAALNPDGHVSAKDGVPLLIDTFDYSQKPAQTPWGNFHNFTGRLQGMWPTDLILFSGLAVRKPAAVGGGGGGTASPAAVGGISSDAGGFAQIIRDQGPDGRYPSDHFFVLAELVRLRKMNGASGAVLAGAILAE